MKYPTLDRMAPLGNFINGTWCGPASEGSREIYCPATQELIALVPESTQEDVDRAVRAGESAYSQHWSKASVEERHDILFELASRIELHADRLALIEVVDSGSTWRRMRQDVTTAAKLLRMFAGMARQLGGATTPLDQRTLAYTVREPFGVVAALTPFNHPILFAAQAIGIALASGNTLVLKPSEFTPLSALELAELSRDLLPPGVLNVITGDGAGCGASLVAHKGVKKVQFRGGAQTGRKVAEACARRMVPVSLELGGKNPMIVCPDANIGDAVRGAVDGLNLVHQGQSCGSATRLLVHEEVAEEFQGQLIAAFESIRPGWPWDPKAEMGAMVSKPHYERVMGFLSRGVQGDSDLLAGGTRITDKEFIDGLYIKPTLFRIHDEDSELLKEEIFGPVACLQVWSEESEVVDMANDTNFGLTASVWTQNISRAHRLASQIDTGLVWLNQHGRRSLGLPTTGRKSSGWGEGMALEALQENTQLKTVILRVDAGSGDTRTATSVG